MYIYIYTTSTIRSRDLTPGHISRENYNSERYMHPNVHCSTVYNGQDMGATWPSTDEWIKNVFKMAIFYSAISNLNSVGQGLFSLGICSLQKFTRHF